MEKLLEIERLSLELEKQTKEILSNNNDSREFLTGMDALKVKENDMMIEKLSILYFEVYKMLSVDQQMNCNYSNIQERYILNTYKSSALSK